MIERRYSKFWKNIGYSSGDIWICVNALVRSIINCFLVVEDAFVITLNRLKLSVRSVARHG